MNELTNALENTFAAFFGPEIEENNTCFLGNRLLQDLGKLGFDFVEQRQILNGELKTELPEELANDVSQYQTRKKAEKEADDAYDLYLKEHPAASVSSPPAYGDWEGTGWMEGPSHWGR